ncbi:uncharacterized protein PG998_011152 [Apiospora kogelbergensis]|uniref:uncharacterized protein n=1 Tax=Apiospora kogelbergensis TaxID=1337665 RepID=UPI00312FA607
MANATSPVAAEGLSFTGNLTLVESMYQWPAAIWNNRDFLLLEVRIVGTAMACIYVSSQAALRRPPSARLPKKKKGRHGKKTDESSEDEYVQGLLLSDAIMFPILAGMVLVGLYYLIKWLEDPAILNKILGVYFSVMSLASMGKLFSDGLQLMSSMVFPEVWRARDGNIFYFDNDKRSQYRISESGDPYMVTVATKLDVPIKLVFEGPTKASMLGLGDIVVPGMFVGLCLRFDHFLYYHRQRKQVPIDLKTTDANSGELVISTQTQPIVVRPDYVNPKSQWGNWFWTTRLGAFLWGKTISTTPALKAAKFPKTYFHAAMIGYLLGMMVTLMMLLVFKHAQPALLYLVPGVVFSVWLVGLFRGELYEMWIYTEDGSLDKEDVVVEVDGDGNAVNKALEKASSDKNAEEKDNSPAEDEDPAPTTVFAFTIEAPASLSRRRTRRVSHSTE